ncbi:MAG: hypothetical protein LAP21_00365 [Acidobacteriia bacterium]|nr:hypothetical protein [Terriglobia bacterium]
MIDLLAIQERHRELYNAFLHNRSKVRTPDYRDAVLHLLEDIRKQSQDGLSFEDFAQLNQLVEQWRSAGPALNMDMSHIALVPPGSDQLAAQVLRPLPKWTDASLQDWVAGKASEISKSRAIGWFKLQPPEVVVRSHRDSISPEEGRQNEQEDWAQAELSLASEVLDGKFDLVRSLTPESYPRLEGSNGTIWLEKVKKLKAFLNWKARGEGWGAEAATADYFKACDEMMVRLLDAGGKAAQSEFRAFQTYVEKHFLAADGTLDLSKERTRTWIAAKAKALQESPLGQGLRESLEAQRQMKKYYENITRAVMGAGQRSDKSARLVVEALGLVPDFSHCAAMVNCFEMALPIYFLDPGKITRAMNAAGVRQAA